MFEVPLDVEGEGIAQCFFEHVMPKIRPNWLREDVHFKEFNGGYSNQIVGISQNEDDSTDILFRMHFPSSPSSAHSLERFFDRELEIKTMQLLYEAGMNPPVYCRLNNAICYGFAKGRTVTQDDLRNKEVLRCIAVTMARYHNLDYTGLEYSNWIDRITEWLPDTVPQDAITAEMDRIGCNYAYLRDEFQKAKKLIATFTSPIVLCHSDTHKGNMIYEEKEGRVTFIDQETTALAHVSCEIGNFFRYFVGVFEDLDLSLYPKEDIQKFFIRSYLRERYAIKAGT